MSIVERNVKCARSRLCLSLLLYHDVANGIVHVYDVGA